MHPRSCSMDAAHALHEACRQGLLEAMVCPQHSDIRTFDWFFDDEKPPYLFLPGYVVNARLASHLRPDWRDELPYIWRKPGTGLPQAVDCYFVDPRDLETALIVTSPYAAHDYALCDTALLKRRYPSSMFFKRVERRDSTPSVSSLTEGVFTTSVYLSPDMLRTLKLVGPTDFITGCC